jgi:hypothetical protein
VASVENGVEPASSFTVWSVQLETIVWQAPPKSRALDPSMRLTIDLSAQSNTTESGTGAIRILHGV